MPKPLKDEEKSDSESSSGESESSESEEEEEKFHAVQRYTKQKPLMLRPEQIHRIREPEHFTDKKVVVKSKKQLYREQQDQYKMEQADRMNLPTDGEHERKELMYFTDSEDDSVASDDEDLTDNERRLANVFWRTRNWVILQNSGLFKLLIQQKESCAVIFTPISPDEEVTGYDRSIRFASLETKLTRII